MHDVPSSCVTRGRERSADNEQVTQENRKKCRKRRRRKIHRLIANKKAEADAKSKEAEVPDETPSYKTLESEMDMLTLTTCMPECQSLLGP